MGAIASQITSVIIVYSTVYSGADQSEHQSSVSLAFVWGIHWGPVNSPHKWPVTWKMFPFDDVVMLMSLMIFTLWWQPYWIFTCRVKKNVGIMITLCFMCFKTWLCIPKLFSYDKYKKNYMILGYNKRRPAEIAAILNKNFPPLVFWGLFTRVLNEHPSNFPENFSFLHFFQLEP